MKQLLSLFILTCFAAICNNLIAQHMVFYTNESDGYSMDLPEDWRRTDTFSTKLSLVALAPEVTEAEDGLRENMNVTVFALENTTLSDFNNDYLASHEKDHRSWKKISDGEVKARDNSVSFFICQYADDKSGRTHADLVYFYEKEKLAYVVTFTTSYDELEKYKPVFDKMARSFSFELEPIE